MDFLNSQYLTSQDGYLHAFRRPGSYQFRILLLPTPLKASGQDKSYPIEVSESGKKEGQGGQHDVVLVWDEKGSAYRPEPQSLKIGVNDFVLWRVETSLPSIPPFSIRGEEKEQEAFNSRALGRHDMFTHLFLMPGSYRYTVGDQAEGMIVVADHRGLSPQEYEKAATKPPLIHILRGKPAPEKVEIFAGMTAMWFVEEGDRISIRAVTDRPKA